MDDKIIYKGIFGSRLYGTNTPDSDYDYKQIHQASLESIVLGNHLDNINLSTNNKTRNTKDDVDFESKELRQFISDCLGGQTYAFDILFTPRDKWEATSDTWESLIANRGKLLTNNIGPFIGYCRGQSMKYSLKGEKLKTLHELRDRLLLVSGRMSLGEFFSNNADLLSLPHLRGYSKKVGKGDTQSMEAYFDVVQTSSPASRDISEVIPSINLQIKNYGKRAEDAMNDGGIDLKAYYHALRICWELEEYLRTGEIVFPSKRVEILLNIRNGFYTKDYVERLINDEINRVLAIENTLPDPDYDFWNSWILDHYIGNRK